MDIETGKVVLTTVSALVAVASAVFAYRSRFQTRKDLFESQRDVLILTMAENDNQCQLLRLRAAFAKAEMERISPRFKSAEIKDEAKRVLDNLGALVERLTTLPKIRTYTPEMIDTIAYSEGALALLRQMSRNEQVNSKHLNGADWDLIFELVNGFEKRFD